MPPISLSMSLRGSAMLVIGLSWQALHDSRGQLNMRNLVPGKKIMEAAQEQTASMVAWGN